MYVITDKLNYCVNYTPLTSKPDQLMNNKNKQRRKTKRKQAISCKMKSHKDMCTNLVYFFVFG